MVRYFETVFRPAAQTFEGYIDVRMLKLRAALMGVAPAGVNYRFALAYKNGTQPITVTITTATKINRQGDHNALHLKTGDRVNIQARTCKADLANGATPPLTASRVTAHPASS